MKAQHLILRVILQLDPPYCGRAGQGDGVIVEWRGKYADYSDVTGVTCKWCLKRMGIRPRVAQPVAIDWQARRLVAERVAREALDLLDHRLTISGHPTDEVEASVIKQSTKLRAELDTLTLMAGSEFTYRLRQTDPTARDRLPWEEELRADLLKILERSGVVTGATATV